MKRFQLNEQEEKVLSTLTLHGAMSPSQVAAQTWMLPGETRSMLQELAGAGFVLLREDTNSPDGWLVAITTEAREYLNGNLLRR